jgi:hypothetical protein
MFMINMKRLNHSKQQKVMISHFPKAKDASYFLIIGNPEKNEILAMKRVTFNRFTSKNLTIPLPESFMTDKIELHLMCDSYIGLDQYHHIDLSLVNQYLQSKGAKPQVIKELRSFKAYNVLKSQVITDVKEGQDDHAILEIFNEGAAGKGVIDEEFDKQG